MPIALDVTVYPRDFTFVINTSESAEVIDVRGAKRGMIYVPDAWTGARITFKGQQKRAANLVSGTITAAPLRDKAGALLAIAGIATAAAGWYEIPEQVFAGPGHITVVSTNTGSEAAVQQTAARALKIVLVS